MISYDFNRHKELFLAVLCFLAAGFLWLMQVQTEQRALAQRIAPEILRFHVVGNSNSNADQEIKLKVKSFLLEKIYQELEDGQNLAWNKEELKQYLYTNRQKLKEMTEEFIHELGMNYPVSLDIVWCDFPEKYYGELRLPAGRYEAAEVIIGKGQGHNWWCVLYPKICITKDAVAALPEDSRKELSDLFSDEDIQVLLAQHPDIHLRLRSVEWIKELLRQFTQPVNCPVIVQHGCGHI